MKSFLYVVGLLCLHFATAPVHADDYWPLEVGNRWVYERRHSFIRYTDDGNGERVELKEEFVLEVLSQEEVDGQVYSRLSNGQLLRKDEEGNIIKHHPFSSPDTTFTEVMIFDVTHLDDPEYRVYGAYWLFPPTPTLCCTPYPAYRSLTTVSVPAGSFDAIYFGDGDLTGGVIIYLALSVGPVLSIRSGNADVLGEAWEDLYELLRYRISGKSYPTAVGEHSWGEIKRSVLIP